MTPEIWMTFAVLAAANAAQEGASADEVKKAYRKLAKELHPDKNPGDKITEDKFKRVTAAFDILGDKEKRAKYDAGQIDGDGNEQYRGFGGGGRAGGSPFGQGGNPFGQGGGPDPAMNFAPDLLPAVYGPCPSGRLGRELLVKGTVGVVVPIGAQSTHDQRSLSEARR